MNRTISRFRRLACAVGLSVLASLSLLLATGGRTSGDALVSQSVEWPQIQLELIASGLSLPVHIGNAGDGSGRLFVVEKAGRIRIIDEGTVLSTPFLDITDRVLSSGGEQGLLSVAFSRDYEINGEFYVDYTRKPDGATVVARFSVSGDPDVADATSEQILLTIDQPYDNHNGGQIAFSPRDGYLYISTGDGGSGGDPHGYAQNPASLLGKILRIDVESSQSPYAIPPSNPFVTASGTRDEIWALGLRNPWRFSFDPSNGDLYIGDVGQGKYEEVDVQAGASSGGQNYGWNIMEGLHCYNASTCNQAGLTLPVAEYGHGAGDCAVTGGMVYRGSRFPRMQGVYFYADYCSGRIWGLQSDQGAWQTEQIYDAPFGITSFGRGEAGELYVADYQGGRVYWMRDPQPSLALSTKTAEPRIAYPGDALTYTITLVNYGDPLTETVTLTDALPSGLAYVPDSLTATWGTVDDSGANLTWQGLMNPTSTVRLTYRSTVSASQTSVQANQATVDAGGAGTYTLRHAIVISPQLTYLPLTARNWPWPISR